MAVVTLSKSYDFSVNQVLSDSNVTANDYGAYTIWKIKDTLVNYPHNPWSVVFSSDATSAGAADYWTDWTAVHWNSGTSAHSWVVLSSSAGGQLLIECSGASTRQDYITVKWSNEGLFVGPGTVGVAPVAADAHALISATVWRSIFYYLTPIMVLHGIHSTDGEIDHIILCAGGVPFLYWGRQTVQCPVPNYNLNNIFFAHTNGGEADSRLSYASHSEQQWWGGKKDFSGDGTGIFNCGLTVMVAGSAGNDLGQVLSSVSTFSGLVPLYPIGVMSMSAGFEGRHGYLTDQWFVPSALRSGTSIEEDYESPTFEIAVFHNMAVPWNGTPPMVS